jgi:hypothetical protein
MGLAWLLGSIGWGGSLGLGRDHGIDCFVTIRRQAGRRVEKEKLNGFLRCVDMHVTTWSPTRR